MSNPTAQDKSLDDIKVGDVASFERVIVEEDVATFARLSGDYNPLHTDVYASSCSNWLNRESTNCGSLKPHSETVTQFPSPVPLEIAIFSLEVTTVKYN